MTVVGIVVLFLGLVVAGAGAGLALFERVEPRGTLRLMAVGVLLAVAGLVGTVLTADEGETLEPGTFVPLIIVIGIVAYAASFARRAQADDAPGADGDDTTGAAPRAPGRVTPRDRRRARRGR